MSTHGPEEGMKGARLLGKEIIGLVMCGGGLRYFSVWLWLHSVDQIRELDRILDEENGDIVSNNV
jgi:hypothetical protein